jgi:hypothetical protein
MSIFDFLKKTDEEDEIVQNDEQALEAAAISEAAQPKMPEPVSFEQKLLTELDQIKKQNDEQVKSAQSWDKWMSLAEGINSALAKKDQARMLRNVKSPGMQAFGTDLKLDTNTASKLMDERKNKISELLDQYKLTNQIRGKKAEPKIMKVGDRVIQVTPTGEARELYKPTESELDKLKVEQAKKDIQLTDKNINKKAGDDLTLEQQEVIKADLDLKKVNLAKAQKELIDSDKSDIEKQQGLANIQKTFADIKKTEAEVEKMNKTSELALLDQVKIKESEARTKESEARTEKYKADSKRLEEDRKQKQEVADLQKKTKERKLIEKNRQDREELENANEKIKKVERLEKLLSKKGGVTGFFDNTVQSLIDSQRVDSEATARNIARQELMDLAVDQTLLKTAQTKGAISDQEMALFQKGIPSLYAQEPEWVTWLGKVKDTQKRLIAKIQETSPTSAQPDQGAQKDSSIEQYAKQYNINYEAAQRILKSRGYNAK